MRKARIARLALACCLAALTVLSVIQPAFAELDLTRTDCSITLEMGGLTGGTVALYRVAGVKKEGVNYYYDVSLGDFPSSATAAKIPAMSQSELDAQNRSLTTDLLREADDNSIAPYKTAAFVTGKAEFTGLKIGLYLVNQTEEAQGKKITPFLVSIPDQSGAYAVNANVKTGIAVTPPVTTPPATTPPATTPPATTPPATTNTPLPTVTPVPSVPPGVVVTPVPPIFYPSTSPTKSYDVLPQTGQLWWPVPVLAALGLVLVIVGLSLRRRRD